MRLPSSLGSLALMLALTAAGCTSPHAVLDGTWATTPNPGGGGLTLTFNWMATP